MNVRPTAVMFVLLALALVLTGCTSPRPSEIRPSSVEDSQAAVIPPQPQPAAETAPSGIVAISDFTPSSVVLTLIDPKSGASRIWRQFESVDDAQIAADFGSVYTSAASRMQCLFTADYDRVVAIKTLADGSQHVGWITSDGMYTDVSTAITPQSGFANAPIHTDPKFGPDGMFYFVDYNANELKRVSPSDLSPEAVKVVRKWDRNNFGVPNGYQVYAKGHVQITDAPQAETSYHDGTSIDLGALLPASSRVNWSPVASPDGKQVAFVSLATNAAAQGELFTVARTGGEPVRVATDYVFSPVPQQLGDIRFRRLLIDWL